MVEHRPEGSVCRAWLIMFFLTVEFDFETKQIILYYYWLVNLLLIFGICRADKHDAPHFILWFLVFIHVSGDLSESADTMVCLFPFWGGVVWRMPNPRQQFLLFSFTTNPEYCVKKWGLLFFFTLKKTTISLFFVCLHSNRRTLVWWQWTMN